MNKAISIFLIDDHKIFSQSFEAFILTKTEFIWKGSADGTGRTINDVIQIKPMILLLDFHLKEVNGLELLKQLREKFFNGLIIMLTMNRDPKICTAAKSFGANGFVSKDAESHDLLQGIIQLVNGKIDFLEINQIKKEKDENPYKLTRQEKSIAEMVCSGMNSEAVANRLNISIHTVHTHRRRILEKTNSLTFLEVCNKLS